MNHKNYLTNNLIGLLQKELANPVWRIPTLMTMYPQSIDLKINLQLETQFLSEREFQLLLTHFETADLSIVEKDIDEIEKLVQEITV